MALPGTLLQTSNPIVEKALETGARGSTSIDTNYGVIGDAMFKKASLDLQIANLQTDFGVKSAQIKSGIEMDRAHLLQNEANIRYDADYKQAQLKLQQDQFNYQKYQDKHANDLSDGEKFFGALQGVASGALAGAATGTPHGMLIGGAIGGITAFAGGATGGRRGQEAALGFVNTAAAAVPAIMDYNKQRILTDSLKGLDNQASKAQAVLNNPMASDVQKSRAAQMIQNVSASATRANIAAGVNPEQAYKAGNAMVEYHTQGTAYDSDPVAAGRSQLKMLSMKAQTDPRANGTPQEKLSLAKEIFPAFNQAFLASNGRLKPDAAQTESAYLATIGPDLSALVQPSGQGGGGGHVSGRASVPAELMQPQITRQNPISNPTERAVQPRVAASRPAEPVAQQPASVSPTVQGGGGVVQRQQAPVRTSGQFDSTGGVPVRPSNLPQGPGVQMNDGGAITPMQLNAQAAKIVRGEAAPVAQVTPARVNRIEQQVRQSAPGAPEPEIRAQVQQAVQAEAQEGMAEPKTFLQKLTTPYKSGEVKESLVSALPGNHERGLEKLVRDRAGLNGPEAKKAVAKKIEAIKEEDPDSPDAEVIETLSRVKKSTDKEDKKVYKYASSAFKDLDKMEADIKAGRYKSGSQMAQIGGDIRDNGVDIGGPILGAAGAAAGFLSPVPGGATIGAGAGAYAGSKMGLKIGKGTSIGMDDGEAQTYTKFGTRINNAINAMAKIQDPGGRVTDSDYKNLEPNFPTPGKSLEENLAGIRELKHELANRLRGASDLMEEGGDASGDTIKAEKSRIQLRNAQLDQEYKQQRNNLGYGNKAGKASSYVPSYYNIMR